MSGLFRYVGGQVKKIPVLPGAVVPAASGARVTSTTLATSTTLTTQG